VQKSISFVPEIFRQKNYFKLFVLREKARFYILIGKYTILASTVNYIFPPVPLILGQYILKASHARTDSPGDMSLECKQAPA